MTGNGDILVVEDVPASLKLLTDILTAAGYAVRPVENGEMAIAAVAHSVPELVLLDLRLPDIDGFEVLKRLKASAESREIPVILLSAVAETSERVAGLRLGAVDFISKPFQSNELLAKVRTHVEFSRMRIRLEQRSVAAVREWDHLSALLNSIADELWFCDVHGKFTLVNPNGVRDFGVSRASMDATLPSSKFEVLRADGTPRPDIENPALMALDGKAVYRQEEILRSPADGGLRYRQISSTPVRDQKGHIIGSVSVVRDITEMKLAEKALKDSEISFRMFFENLPMGVVIYRPEPESGDFVISYFGSEAERIEGVKKEKLLGKKVTAVFPGIKEMGLLDIIRQVAADGRPRTLTSSYYKDPDHSGWRENTVYRLPDGQIVAVYRDTTEIETTRLALNESEARYRSLFEQAKDSILLLEMRPTGVPIISDANAAALRMHGYSREELLGKPISFLDAEESPEALIADRTNKIKRAGNAVFEARHRRKDGSVFDLEVSVMQIELRGKPFLLDISRDITARKHGEAAVRASEAKYRALFENMNSACCLDEVIYEAGRPADYRILDVNPAYERITGITAQKARGALASELYGMVPYLDVYSRVAETGKPVSFESYLDPIKKYLSITVGSPGKGLFSTVFSDITDRKKSEEALRFKNMLLSTQAETSIDGILVVDEAGKIVSFNSRFVEMWGISREVIESRSDELALRSVLDKLSNPKEFIDRVKYLYEHMDEKSKEEIILLDGRALERYSAPMISGEGKYYGRVWYFRDITERKSAEAGIKGALEMQNVLNLMLQKSLSNTPLRDKLNGHLVSLFSLPWLNIQPMGAVFVMNSKKNTLILTAHHRLAPDLVSACAEVPLGRCLCGKAAESGRVAESTCVDPGHHISYPGMQPHGHYCVPIGIDGKILGVLNLYLKEGVALSDKQRHFMKSVTDIMAENILHAQMEEKLSQSQKMESVGRLAGGVAHDFNNILTAIKGYCAIVSNALTPEDPRREDMGEIMNAAERATNLTRQLLAFSRRQIMATKVVDLNKCVADVSNMLRRLIGENIALTISLSPVPCLALLDAGQLEQVLVNLIVNSRDAMPKGGTVEISTELLPYSPELFQEHQELPRVALVCLKVRDTGCGMTAEVMKHLFEPFYTTKEQGRGTGLGLSMVFGIVKQSGGDIEIDSEPGKGTETRIFFPYCASGTGSCEAGACASVPDSVKGHETILLVEDEESLRRLGRRVLSANGYTVLTAASGAEALKELERHGKPVDLLITDVIMPGMNGRDLACEIARRNMTGRVLYMSGYTDDDIVKHGVLEPGIAFIYKPFTVEALAAKLREVLDGPADQAKA